MNEYQYFFDGRTASPPPPAAPMLPQNIEMIDPLNPFSNPTEFPDYNSDYGEIVPQIRIPGCRIPLRPNQREKRRIRRYHNIVGGFLLGHFVFSNLLAFILIQIFYLILYGVDTAATGGNLPGNYDSLAQDYLSNSSTMVALNLLVYGAANLLAIFFGCKASHISIPKLFQTKDFNAAKAVMYIAIILMIQTATAYIADWITTLLESIGISPYEPDLLDARSLNYTIISLIYSVLIAPVTEELLMRGFVMKNLSRAGQRFGIIMSAFLFGIWHENLAQFVLAFAGGCFFGYIAVKHNSLVPSIICHMAANLFAELFSMCDTYGWEAAATCVDILYTVLVLAGVVLLIRMFFTERMPYAMPEQSERGFRILLTSPLMLLVIAAHIGAGVYYTLAT